FFFFFNDTATTEIYTLSLHDALPISVKTRRGGASTLINCCLIGRRCAQFRDRKSTRLNSSHTLISYAVFCLKKKKDLSIEACSKNKHFGAVSRPSGADSI